MTDLERKIDDLMKEMARLAAMLETRQSYGVRPIDDVTWSQLGSAIAAGVRHPCAQASNAERNDAMIRAL